MKFYVGGDGCQGSDSEIDESGAEALEAFDAGDVVETQFDFGMGPAEHFDESGQDVENGGPAGGNLDAAFVDFGAALLELFVEVFELLDERSGHFKEHLAVMGEADFRAVPHEELHSDFTFESLNLLGHRGLAQAHAFGRFGNAAGRRCVAEATELLKPILLVSIAGVAHRQARFPVEPQQ